MLDIQEIKAYIDANQVGELSKILSSHQHQEIEKLRIGVSFQQTADLGEDKECFVDLGETNLTLLEYAVYKGKEKVVDYLLRTYHFDVTEQVFEFAFRGRNVGVVQRLLEEVKANDAELVLIQAIEECPHDHKFIVEHIHQRFHLQLDPHLLHRAILKNKPLIARYLAYFVLVNTPNEQGLYPVHLAAHMGDLKLIEMLYQQGADLRVKTAEGKTIFNLISEDKKSELGKLFARLKAREHITTLSCQPPQPIENIVLKGGGVKGLAYPSAILEAQRQGLIDLRQIKRVGGASAGAIAALFLALGYSPEEVQQKLDGMRFDEMLDTTCPGLKDFMLGGHWTITGFLQLLITQTRSVSGVCSQLGLCQGELLRNWLEAQIRERIAQLLERPLSDSEYNNLTFKELHHFTLPSGERPFKDLAVMGTNVTTGRSEVYSYEKTPNMCITDAVRISAGFPGAFVPHYRYDKINGVRKKVSNDLRVDGGMLANFPVLMFDNGERNLKTLGFCLVSEEHKEEFMEGTPLDKQAKDGFFDYVGRLFSTIMGQQDADHAKSGDYIRTVYIDHKGTPTLKFNLSEDQKSILIEAGTEGVWDFLDRRKPNLPWELSRRTIETLIQYHVLRVDGLKLVPTDTPLTAQQVYVLYAEADLQEIYALREIVNPNAYLSDGSGNSPLHYAYTYQRQYEKAVKNLLTANANPTVMNQYKILPSQATEEHSGLKWEEQPYLHERNQQMLQQRMLSAEKEKGTTLELTQYFDKHNTELEETNKQLQRVLGGVEGENLALRAQMEELQRQLRQAQDELAGVQQASKTDHRQSQEEIARQKRRNGDRGQLLRDLESTASRFHDCQSSESIEKAKVVVQSMQTLVGNPETVLDVVEVRGLTAALIETSNLVQRELTEENLRAYKQRIDGLKQLDKTFFGRNKFASISNAMLDLEKTLRTQLQQQHPGLRR